jgi:hypothetical protein
MLLLVGCLACLIYSNFTVTLPPFCDSFLGNKAVAVFIVSSVVIWWYSCFMNNSFAWLLLLVRCGSHSFEPSLVCLNSEAAFGRILLASRLSSCLSFEPLLICLDSEAAFGRILSAPKRNGKLLIQTTPYDVSDQVDARLLLVCAWVLE